jgi:hypothetical protein
VPLNRDDCGDGQALESIEDRHGVLEVRAEFAVCHGRPGNDVATKAEVGPGGAKEEPTRAAPILRGISERDGCQAIGMS